MPYIANQYNYATPLTSVESLVAEKYVDSDVLYFTLFNNNLSGRYIPVSGDVGIWSASLSDANGILEEPFVVTVTPEAGYMYVSSICLTGNRNNYPVAFTIQFYNSGRLMHTVTESANSNFQYAYVLPSPLICSEYTITITRISAANSAAMLYNINYPTVVATSDNVDMLISESGTFGESKMLHAPDNINVASSDVYSGINIITSVDELVVASNDASNLINVHSVMKQPFRRIYGKVYITYTDPMLDSETSISTSSTAYNSVPSQVLDGNTVSDNLPYFTLYDNDLTGNYVLMSEQSQVGWFSSELSNDDGTFTNPQELAINLTSRPITSLVVYFDNAKGCVPKDFSVTFVHENGAVTSYSFADNASANVFVTDSTLIDVVSMTISISSVTKPGMPANVLEIPLLSTILYEGYKDHSSIVSIDLLEELTYDDSIEALGGISANEVRVVLDNSKSDFYFNNKDSIVARQLKRNRKIVPWLGTEISPGTIEWYRMGTYWSYRWDVPVNSLTASVVGFDTIGLLDTTSFTKHKVLLNKSIGELVEYVLLDAKETLSFIDWRIDPALYDIIIPYAWFEQGSHTAALRKISKSYPLHIYCDRDGNICAAPQKIQLDYFYDAWADSDTVINKEYNSLYTTVPNVINVTVKIPQLVNNESLVKDALAFNIGTVSSRILKFSKPYVDNISVNVSCDSTVRYTYTVYSWGIELNFTGTGNVTSIECVGTALDVSNTSIITHTDDASVRLNGAIARSVEADFIQTIDLASRILSRFDVLSKNDRYDVNVDYRGDIALTINDPILLLDGIAPDNRYNIRRHELYWDGALSGSADLNT